MRIVAPLPASTKTFGVSSGQLNQLQPRNVGHPTIYLDPVLATRPVTGHTCIYVYNIYIYIYIHAYLCVFIGDWTFFRVQVPHAFSHPYARPLLAAIGRE